jgi:hypothetical protein
VSRLVESGDPVRVDPVSPIPRITPCSAGAHRWGFYESPWGRHPKLQILTVDELLAGAKIDMPPAGASVTFKKAEKPEPLSTAATDQLFDGEAPEANGADTGPAGEAGADEEVEFVEDIEQVNQPDT